jgi:hypothetical protein
LVLPPNIKFLVQQVEKLLKPAALEPPQVPPVAAAAGVSADW